MTSGRAVAVFGSSRTPPGSLDWESAEEVGGKLARSGFAVLTGGYGGTMEAVSKGASAEGGHVIGVTAPSLFPERSGPNAYVKELIEADGLLSRIGTMIERAGGVIALPGSIGTATELLVAWNHNYLTRRNGGKVLPTVAVGEGWRNMARAFLELGSAEAGDVQLVAKPDQAVDWLLTAI